MPKQEMRNLSDLFKDVSEELVKTARTSNIYNYDPYKPAQLDFHRHTDVFGRLFLGGNRAGKTDSNVIECIWNATDTHPHMKERYGRPVQGRCVVVDIEKGINQIMLPKFKRWMAPSMLVDGDWDKSYSERSRVLTFSNGSTIDFLTYEMTMDKHGGVPRDFISFDEEPPQHLFNEGMQRLIDFDGKWWASLTPLQGMSWMFETIYEPNQNDPAFFDKTGIKVFQAQTSDNPYNKGRDLGKFSFAMGEEEKESRYKGNFMSGAGLIFPEFAKQTRNERTGEIDVSHIIPSVIPPKDWEWYMSMDEGWNNPTAVLWHAVGPDGTIVTFSEHYASGMTLKEHAAAIHLREAGFGRVPDLRTGDPAMKQTTTHTGLSKQAMLAEDGIDLALDRVPRDVETGIQKMQQYFRISPVTGKPKWFVTDNCVNFIREMKGLRWATYSSRKMQFENNKQETVHKKNDHTFDSARYFATFLPDLRPEALDLPPQMPNAEQSYLSFDTIMARAAADPDTQVMWDANQRDQWETVDSFQDLYG